MAQEIAQSLSTAAVPAPGIPLAQPTEVSAAAHQAAMSLRSRALAWARAHADMVTAALVALLTLGHLLRIYNRGFNLLDEGFVLHVAERVLEGQVPYRDFFTQLTPGAFLALAGVFSITGPSVIVGRWVTVALGLAMTLLLYWSGRRLVSRPVAALAALAFPVWGIGQGWFYPNYSWFALTAALLGFAFLIKALGHQLAAPGTLDLEPAAEGDATGLQGRLPWLLAAGFSCGLAAFCKQNMGLYALVALLSVWLLVGRGGWRGRVAGGGALLLSASVIPLGLVWWLAAHGALRDFYRDAVWIPLAVFPKEMAAPYPAFWPPWPLPTDPPGQEAWSFRLICLLPPLPYGFSLAGVLWLTFGRTTLRRTTRPVAGQRRWQRLAFHWLAPNPPRDALLAWLAFALAIWLTAFPRADFDHIQVAVGPLFVLAAFAFESAGRVAVRRRVWRLWGAPDTKLPVAYAPAALGIVHRPTAGWRGIDGTWCRQWLPQALSGLLLCGFLVAGVRHARALHMGPRWTMRTLDSVAPRASGVLLDYDDVAELSRLVSEVRRLSAPGETIVALPWNAGLYFLAERPNASRYDLFIPASILPDDMPEIEQSLDSARLIVYWTARDTFINNTSLEDRLPSLHDRVTSRYHPVVAINAYRLLVRD